MLAHYKKYKNVKDFKGQFGGMAIYDPKKNELKDEVIFKGLISGVSVGRKIGKKRFFGSFLDDGILVC